MARPPGQHHNLSTDYDRPGDAQHPSDRQGGEAPMPEDGGQNEREVPRRTSYTGHEEPQQ